MATLESLLGRAVKTAKWTAVAGSNQKFSAAELEQIDRIEVRNSDFDDDCYAVVILKDGSWCNMPKLDKNLIAEAGDMIDPKTFRLFKLTNGEKTIERCLGKLL